MLNRALILLIALFFAGCSTTPRPAEFHQRFWRGYQRSDLKQPEFEARLNREVFAQYTATHPPGLVSYIPVLPVRARTGGPHVWALTTHRADADPQAFAAIETSGNLFVRATSFNTPVEPFDGKAQKQKAYTTDAAFSDYDKAKVVFALYVLPTDEDRHEEIAENIERNHGASKRDLKNIVFMITQDHVAEFLFFRPNADLTSLLPSLNADQVMILRDEVPGRDEIREGRGMKSRF